MAVAVAVKQTNIKLEKEYWSDLAYIMVQPRAYNYMYSF